jgi:hypothetical protein
MIMQDKDINTNHIQAPLRLVKRSASFTPAPLKPDENLSIRMASAIQITWQNSKAPMGKYFRVRFIDILQPHFSFIVSASKYFKKKITRFESIFQVNALPIISHFVLERGKGSGRGAPEWPYLVTSYCIRFSRCVG